MMLQDVNLLHELFYSLEMYSLLGPLLIVTAVYLINKKAKGLGVVWWLAASVVFAGEYMTLINDNGWYMWHLTILLLGGTIAILASLVE